MGRVLAKEFCPPKPFQTRLSGNRRSAWRAELPQHKGQPWLCQPPVQICKLSLQASALEAESGFYEILEFAREAKCPGARVSWGWAGGCSSLLPRAVPTLILWECNSSQKLWDVSPTPTSSARVGVFIFCLFPERAWEAVGRPAAAQTSSQILWQWARGRE